MIIPGPSAERHSGPADLPDICSTTSQGTNCTRQLVVLQNFGYYPRKEKAMLRKGLIWFLTKFWKLINSNHSTFLFQLSLPSLKYLGLDFSSHTRGGFQTLESRTFFFPPKRNFRIRQEKYIKDLKHWSGSSSDHCSQIFSAQLRRHPVQSGKLIAGLLGGRWGSPFSSQIH